MRIVPAGEAKPKEPEMIQSPCEMLVPAAPANPVVATKATIERVVSAELPQYVRREEVHEALRRLADRPRVAVFVEFIWLTGARISEALAVRRGDLDLRSSPATVRLVTLKRRRRAERVLPLPDPFARTLSILAASLGAQERLFPWNRARAGQLVRGALEAAGVGPDSSRKQTRASARGLRHGHAVHLIGAGVPLSVVQRGLGHAFISSTNVYAAVTASDVAREYARVEW
jgi:integrase